MEKLKVKFEFTDYFYFSYLNDFFPGFVGTQIDYYWTYFQ